MKSRIQSIDALRALTMLLMIWVNDFWSLTKVPDWLLHVSADTDGMGFSDVIFPVFLFIVGLSIPFALRARKKKGDTPSQIIVHILTRTGALLLMGLLMVNLDFYHEETAMLPKPIWQVTMIAAFFLIWNHYPKQESWQKKAIALRSVGWGLILVLLATFRSDPESGYNWIEPHWWGILGLIGWSYLVCSIVALAGRERILPAAAAWLALALFNVGAFAGWLGFLDPISNYVWVVGNASIPALTMAGCLVSLLFIRFSEREQWLRFCLIAVVAGAGLIMIGFLLRPLGGLSKINGTPSWTHICTGIAMISFALSYWLVDLKKIDGWSRVIAPAGAATLTCYLLPYLAYPLFSQIGFDLPDILTSGALGLLKSFVFAFAIVGATGLVNRLGIKLGI